MTHNRKCREGCGPRKGRAPGGGWPRSGLLSPERKNSSREMCCACASAIRMHRRREDKGSVVRVEREHCRATLLLHLGNVSRSGRASGSQCSGGTILWSLRKSCDFLAKWRYRGTRPFVSEACRCMRKRTLRLLEVRPMYSFSHLLHTMQ